MGQARRLALGFCTSFMNTPDSRQICFALHCQKTTAEKGSHLNPVNQLSTEG